MKQKELVHQINQACLAHNQELIIKLRKEEYIKIFNRRDNQKPFNGKWTVINI